MRHRLIEKGNKYFSQKWRVMAYQPVLYLFVFAATVRLWLNKTEPPNFDYISRDFYHIWQFLGITGPLFALFSWHLVTHCVGTRRYMGMWFRLASDIMVFTNLLTFHIVITAATKGMPVAEGRLFSRYVFASTLVMCLIWVIRDVWTLFLTERLASRIHFDNQ